jgi:hypothetical protein
MKEVQKEVAFFDREITLEEKNDPDFLLPGNREFFSGRANYDASAKKVLRKLFGDEDN